MNEIISFKKIKEEIPNDVKLIAVSKTKPNREILKLYNEGCRNFGENKVQDLQIKYDTLPKDIQWHFIGHLQSNKVKYIAPFISLIHSVDSLKLLDTVNKEGLKNNRIIPCLLQFHIARETSKFGLSLSEAKEIFISNEYKEMKNISIDGVMGMATYTNDYEQIKSEFSSLKKIYVELKNNYFINNLNFKEISMGMSGDYEIAIDEGSTMVRIGSLLFGERNYSK